MYIRTLLCFHDTLDALLLNSLLEIDPDGEAKDKCSRDICDLSQQRDISGTSKILPTRGVLTVTNGPWT